MSAHSKALNSLFQSVFAASLVSGCATEMFPKNANDISHAFVSGAPARLKMFHERLKQIEGVSDLEEAYIGCNQCENLSAPSPPSALDYYFATEHKTRPEKFSRAWSEVMAAQPNGGSLSLLLDRNLVNLVQGACPPIPPAPATCRSAPWCNATDQCDRYPGQSGCQVCPKN